MAALLTEPEPVVEQPAESEWLTFMATAYTARCQGCTGITKSGIDVRHTIVDEEDRRIIAVDPDVIPLGSTLNVRIGNETFDAIAADIGGAIRGNRIDVLMETKSEAMTFGRREVSVRVVDK